MSKAATAKTLPFASFEWMVAGRYLRARRASGFVSVIALISFLGIMVGVAALIVVMSVMNGFHKELLDKIVGVNGHIFLQAADTPLTDYDRVVTDVKRVKGVQLAIPMVEGAAGVSSPFNQAGALVRGVKEADLKELPGIAGHVKIGSLEGFDKAEGVAIGQGLAESLSLRVGDSITILTAKGAQTPFGVAPRIKSYPVTAIFQIGMAQFDNLFVYMPLPEAQAFFNKDGEATVIELFLKNPEQIDSVRSDIDLAVPRPMIMTDWRERNKTFFDALKVERNVMFIIVTLIVLVAALNIISGLIMLVKDKSADIAILRTMGAPRGSIMRIFLITGTAIGVSGTFAGFVLGLVIAENIEAIRSGLNELLHTNLFPAEIYFLSRLPSVVEPSDVITVVVMTLSLSVLATLYPSWRAARLDPVEALRYG
ncbi:lipoprotein-releasing ABC transporter permease subunit [Beijerinckia sp. L45]|uniref:lipoprotein-releasing ABC transporter permease subunit n=1 Tax=Beijerinckia sp. L45 TaxID=1641855 RepID=UPI00131E63EB|nr:lipoprotein-releasing ABC transporter permease subunit [Beijerinckia sp. L45]